MKHYFTYAASAALIAALAAGVWLLAQEEKPGPPIRVVDAGGPGKAPSDATVLFDGHNLSQWTRRDGTPALWSVEKGEMVVKSGSGDIYSKPKFKDAQIHVEFATPNMTQAHGQARANSGVYLQGRYEIQILDSYNNPTYAMGSAGSVYGQHDPLVNVSRPPEQWQTYDIVFHAPKCNGAGTITTPGRVTILHNGVLIQDEAGIGGPTGGGQKDHLCEAGPLELQDHQHPEVKATFMRFRNVWFRPL